jgi:hypothetical protein
MTDEIKYLPFNAINEFMRDDYRLQVLMEVFTKMESLPSEKKSSIGKLVSRFVSIQGFRNGNLAPAGRKAKSSVQLFQGSPEFAGLVLESWKTLHPELAKEMFEILTAKNWEDMQPFEVDRSKLPGFLIHWPKADTFEELAKALKEKAPSLDESEDNISLMGVWMGNRLPYDLFVEEEK